MPAILRIVGRFVLDFAKTDEFERLQQIRMAKIRYQQAILKNTLLAAEEREGLLENLEEELGIFKKFSEEYVPYSEWALARLERAGRRKELDKEVRNALKGFSSFISFFIEYNRRRLFGTRDSLFVTAVSKQLEAVRSAKYHRFMVQLELQKNMETDLYNMLKNIKLEGKRLSRFKEEFDPAKGYADFGKVWAELNIPLRAKIGNPSSILIAMAAIAGVLIIAMKIGAMIGNNKVSPNELKKAENYVEKVMEKGVSEGGFKKGSKEQETVPLNKHEKELKDTQNKLRSQAKQNKAYADKILNYCKGKGSTVHITDKKGRFVVVRQNEYGFKVTVKESMRGSALFEFIDNRGEFGLMEYGMGSEGPDGLIADVFRRGGEKEVLEIHGDTEFYASGIFLGNKAEGWGRMQRVHSNLDFVVYWEIGGIDDEEKQEAHCEAAKRLLRVNRLYGELVRDVAGSLPGE